MTPRSPSLEFGWLRSHSIRRFSELASRWEVIPISNLEFCRALARWSKRGAPVVMGWQAVVEFKGGAIDCIVRDLSTTGAAVELSSQISIPDKCVLVVPGDGLNLPCEIVWRKRRSQATALRS
jgi:hypothetical protein